MPLRALLSIGLLLMSTPAQAHTGVGSTTGFAHRFLHPLGGLDHALVMIAVGLFAVQLGGRAIWLVPLSFVSMMVVGGALGMPGVELPFLEIGIALSVIVLGAGIALGLHLPTAAAMVLIVLFAIFHGHAHGAEMPESALDLAYGAGFVIATVMLHACGIGFGLLLGRLDSRDPDIACCRRRDAVAGITILAGAI